MSEDRLFSVAFSKAPSSYQFKIFFKSTLTIFDMGGGGGRGHNVSDYRAETLHNRKLQLCDLNINL